MRPQAGMRRDRLTQLGRAGVARWALCAYTPFMHNPLADLQRSCAVVASECICSHLRMAARAVTQSFDEFLRPTGIRATQLPVLVALALAECAPISGLGTALGMDRTTLTRNLGPLEKGGLVEAAAGGDRRQRLVRLTPAGERALRRALPLWRRAQERVLERLGPARWAEVLPQLRAVAGRARLG